MILFEDEYILVVNKPNNILVHHSKMANNKIHEKSLICLLRDKYTKKYYPIHRLDRKTSGIVLFAKKKELTTKFQKLFQSNQINKTYYGVVRGFTPKDLIIDSDVKGRDAKTYKTALTKLKRIATIELEIPVSPYTTSRYSLVELKPKTGRLHQLRIHMNKITHPLIGDPKYGDRFHNRMFSSKFNCNTLLLHAKEVSFIHPFTYQEISINADFPKNWHGIFNIFNRNIYI
jgi:tRNA pseudouridine65 synthase